MTYARSDSIRRFPRGLLVVRAAASDPPDVKAAIADLNTAFAEFKRTYDGRVDDLTAAVDGMAISAAAHQLGAGSRDRALDPEYTANFTGFLRNGDNEGAIREANAKGMFSQIRASMSVGTPGDGGYLAPTEWDRTITRALEPLSPMRRLATVKVTTVNAYSTLWKLTGFGSGWVGETAVRPETTTGTFASLTFGHGEIYANAASTQRLLDDAQIDVAQFIADEVDEEFAKQENIAFLAGNGTNKPYGLLTYAVGAANAAVHPAGALDTITVASASAITADELVDFFYGLDAPYRQNSTWLMSSTTGALIAKLKDGQGNYLWRESFAAGQPQTLLGRPVEFDENMPAIAASALPIAFGDFRAGYLINDRTGLRILRDPYTNKPYVIFYCTKRVGGGVRDPNAIRVLKMAAA